MIKIELNDNASDIGIRVEHHVTGSIVMSGTGETLASELGFMFHTIMSRNEYGYDLICDALEHAIDMSKNDVK